MFKVDEQLKEHKLIENVTENISINYYRFKGIGPVADRDFTVVDCFKLEGDGSKLTYASSSIDYKIEVPKGVVRGECIIGGYII